MRIDRDLLARLREAATEWREVLRGQVPLARQIVQKLLADREKITMTPDPDGGWRFRALRSVERLVAGVVPGLLQAMVPRTGFEPVLPP